jgi:ribosomal protein L34
MATSRTLQPEQRKKKADLVHLLVLPTTEPETAAGRVAWIWPEIQAGLATGKRLNEIWRAAQQDGLRVPYSHFRVYVSRLRHRDRAIQNTLPPSPGVSNSKGSGRTSPAEGSPADPFHNLRVERERKRQFGFEYSPFSNRKKLVG